MSRLRALPVAACAALAACSTGAAPPAAAPAPAVESPAPPVAAPPVAATAPVAEVRSAWTVLQAAKWKDKPAASAAFRDALARAGWERLDVSTDRALLIAGLRLVSDDAMDKGDAALAVRALDALRDVADPAARAEVESVLLPAAHVAAGDVAGAVRLLETAAASQDASLRGPALVGLGDLRAMESDAAGAASFWRRAGEVPRGAASVEAFRAWKSDAAVRILMNGKQAPELPAGKWVGGAPRTPASLRGRVVVAYVFETNCIDCRRAVRSMSAALRRLPDDGLDVVGLIPRSDTCYRAPDGDRDPWEGGDVRTCLDEDKYDGLIERFRAATGLGFPLIVAHPVRVAPFEAAMEENVVVIDRDGKVAFATPGHRRVATVEAVAARLLARR